MADGSKAPKSAAMMLLDTLEKRLGKGPTFSSRDQKLIIQHGVPAWLVYAARTAPTEGQKQHCQQVIDQLVALRDGCNRYLPDGVFGGKGE